MADYPRDQLDFENLFSSETACRAYLYRLRWPDGFRCPRCRASKGWLNRRGLMECAECGHQVSVTAGTVFQDTHKPLVLWFRAMWFVTSQKNGANAMGLQRALGLGSYQTAWVWLHKLRRAMVRPGREKLSGLVEVDETFVGGEEEGVGGRKFRDKSLVVIAVEADGKRLGRIRMCQVADTSADSLRPFLKDSIEAGSTIHTDGWAAYKGIEQFGYTHQISSIGANRKDANRLLPRVHLVVGLLKRWLLGTHQGSVSSAHLDYYLDEFTFRFNRRRSASRGKLFYRLVQQAVNAPATTYPEIVTDAKVRTIRLKGFRATQHLGAT